MLRLELATLLLSLLPFSLWRCCGCRNVAATSPQRRRTGLHLPASYSTRLSSRSQSPCSISIMSRPALAA